jgi:hypothetical protein
MDQDDWGLIAQWLLQHPREAVWLAGSLASHLARLCRLSHSRTMNRRRASNNPTHNPPSRPLRRTNARGRKRAEAQPRLDARQMSLFPDDSKE